jgi:hypothetical protein
MTIHDATHVNALWEIASIVTHDSFDINPTEVFVFGAAVLLHDEVMTFAAFPRCIARGYIWARSLERGSRDRDGAEETKPASHRSNGRCI